MQMEHSAANQKLGIGVRFHPTDKELVVDYLKKKVHGQSLDEGYVAEVDIYKHHPAELRNFACFKKEQNWYFFCTIGKKYGSGNRKSRSTKSGFWKPTGNPRPVRFRKRTVGKVKTLVFHEGKSAKFKKTDWYMYEYGLEESESANKDVSDATVLCKIFKKESQGSRNGEQYGAPYDEDECNIEEENNVLAPVVDQDQSAFAVMNDLVDANANSLHTPEQVYSGVVSVSGAYHAPTPISEDANNAAVVVDQNHQSTFSVMNDLVSANANSLHTPEQVYSGVASASGVYHAPTPISEDVNNSVVVVVDQAVDGMPAADIGSSSQAPVLNYTDDADDCRGKYDDFFNYECPGGMTLEDLLGPL